jgi:membrane dipeptidase
MVAFVPTFLSQERRDWWTAGAQGEPPLVGVRHVADHLDHVRRIAGPHAVGIGADFDGTDAMPDGLADVSCYPALFSELRARGWSEDDLAAAAHGNVLRVLEASDADHVAFLGGQAGAPTAAAMVPAVDTTTRKGTQ